MSKRAVSEPDILVLGRHPSALFALALLKQTANLNVIHAGLIGERPLDRLVMINPATFDLHPILAELKPQLELAETVGLHFLADDPKTASEYSSGKTTSYIASFKQLQSAMQKIAGAVGTESSLTIHGVDETGVDLSIGRSRCRPKLLLLAGPIPAEARAALGLTKGWDADVLHRYSMARLKPARALPATPKENELLPMSLDLNGSLRWAWLLTTPGCVQLSIEEPTSTATEKSTSALLQKWADVLAGHGYLKPVKIDAASITSIDLPFAGALAQDLVANRTLLFGPAGGFFTACAEEIYPCFWSAIFAVAAAKTALKERFVQDGLQSYRQKWGGTLGDYLRGPQQNLKFLLPLVYRNPTMAARLAEAILLGESVVR